MFWFALVPGFCLCTLVLGLIVSEWLASAASEDDVGREVTCPLCGSLQKHAFAEDYD